MYPIISEQKVIAFKSVMKISHWSVTSTNFKLKKGSKSLSFFLSNT